METVLTLPEAAAPAPPIRANVLLFHEPRSLELLRRVERVAESEATVLIIGETGTGKELVARHVHKVSARRGPFIAVNCGAFSETLIDAELFGHEAGAFTGASRSREGWFEAADGGTLFLDEIGDLTPALQVKLLRVLQERQVVRLGSRQPRTLDVRLVAATNVDLLRAVEARRFRADLYYRLGVARIDLPSLRERPGDILPLAAHFMRTYGDRMGLRVALSDDARAALLAYPWPGNIRELENVIHHALIVVRDGEIRAGDLGLAESARPMVAQAAPSDEAVSSTPSAAPPRAAAPPTDGPPPGVDDLDALLRQLVAACVPDLFRRVEAALVRAAFQHSGENQVHSARLLGVTRNTLRTLLKRHGFLAAQAGEFAAGTDIADFANYE